MCVRSPASRSRNSRSTPTAPPSTAASTSRRSASLQESETTSAPRSIRSLPLRGRDHLDAAQREVEQLVELLARERLALGGRLHFDEPAVAGRDDVEVDVGARVLRVVEVEERLAVDDP